MQPENTFFFIFLITILITRIFLYFKPKPSPTIKRLRLHHYMYGIIILIIGLLLDNLASYAIGLGLFIDELTFLFIGGKNHEDNYSNKSLVGTLILVIIVFFFRDQITYFIR